MASANVLQLNDSNFDSEINKGATPVLVDFWAPWCGPCRMIAPVLDKIADAMAGQAIVAKVNVDEAPGVAGRFRVSSIPTLLFFKNGEVREQVVGLQGEADLTSRLKALGLLGMIKKQLSGSHKLQNRVFQKLKCALEVISCLEN